MDNPRWKAYQEEVAAFLSRLGFDVQVDETIRGARAEHKIDVTARMSIASVNQCWIVECKSWRNRIPKERALTFRGVVEDVGADRGFMFSESGFQRGAFQAVRLTNITLTSLTRFYRDFPNEVSSATARVFEDKITTLMQAFTDVWDLPEPERKEMFVRYCGPPGFLFLQGSPHAIIGVTARLSQMKQALEDARFNRWPVAYHPLDQADGEFFEVTDWEGLLFVVEKTLLTCDRIYSNMTALGTERSSWESLQPPELIDLLADIRRSSMRRSIGNKPSRPDSREKT